MNETKRARYTLEFKMEAVRLVRVRPGGCGHSQGAGHSQADAGELGQAP